MKIRYVFFLIIFITEVFAGDKFTINSLISDSLKIQVAIDSTDGNLKSGLIIKDNRKITGNVLGIHQTKKYKYFPVDQYIVLNQSLKELLNNRLAADSVAKKGTLTVSNLTLWYDGKPHFQKGLKLNGYSVLYDENDLPVSDWTWEVFVKKEKKQKPEEQISALVDKWLNEQVNVIKTGEYNQKLYPHLYRRQLITWYDLIFFRDGFAVNAHLTLDFPADQEKKFIRGAPGVYFRKSKKYESIAIGGRNQIWYTRLNDRWLGRIDGGLRIGVNNFNREYYSQMDYWNIMFVNFGLHAMIEYRPVYHKGLFGGIGVFQCVNLLPTVVDSYEMGVSMMIGVLLP